MPIKFPDLFFFFDIPDEEISLIAPDSKKGIVRGPTYRSNGIIANFTESGNFGCVGIPEINTTS